MSLTVMSANLNGIRAARRKGFFAWVLTQDVDVICVQETKAQTSKLAEDQLILPGYTYYFADALKPGYSGVGIYTRLQPERVVTNFGHPVMDDEGRYIQIDIGQYSIVSLYMPSGTSGEARQTIKYTLMDALATTLLKPALADGRDWIIAGDWNIAHRKIDLKNWQSNQKSSGFLPEERAWMDQIMDWGWVDSFRVLNQAPDQYSWWTYRGGARARNVGWRIDYQMVSPSLQARVEAVEIETSLAYSDHAALIHRYMDAQ